MARQYTLHRQSARRLGVWNVEVLFSDATTGVGFWSPKAKYTTKREAIADMTERQAIGVTCRVTNDKREQVAP